MFFHARNNRLLSLSICTLLFIVFSVVSQTSIANPSLVKDVNDNPVRSDSDVLCSAPVGVGKIAFLCANLQLWLSDGTTAGTRRVITTDGDTIRSPEKFVRFNESVLFFAEDMLWTSDGTPHGTHALRDANGRTVDTSAKLFRSTVDSVFFFRGRQLWKTNGEIAELIVRLPLTTELPQDATVFDGELYFINTDHELWKSNGTTAGTVLVTDLPGRAFGEKNFVEFKGTLYFTLKDDTGATDLWKSDGSASGTAIVKQEILERQGSVQHPVVVDDRLFFNSTRAANLTLWVSDGSTDGTIPVKSIPARTTSGAAKVNGRYAFEAAGDLWISDGTDSGTQLLVNELRSIFDFAVFNDRLFFALDSGSGQGTELWSTDGTPSGTRLVRDIRGGPKSSNPDTFGVFGSGVLFDANQGTHKGGPDLWVSDATRRGTRAVGKGIFGSTKWAYPSALTRVGDEIYFLANMTTTPNIYHQWQLWKTDGSRAGTHLVANPIEERTVTPPHNLPGHDPLGNEFGELIAFDKRLYFVARDATGWHLRKTDGTPDGIETIPLMGGAPIDRPYDLTIAGGDLYFFADIGDGPALWRAAPGASAAQPVAEALTAPSTLVAFQDALFFVDNGSELWRSDGRSGAALVAVIAVGDENALDRLIVINPDRLSLRVLYDQSYPEHVDIRSGLWVTDGTETGTHPLTAPYPRDLLFHDDALWFEEGRFGEGLWIYDGLEEEARLLSDESVERLTVVGDLVYYYRRESNQIWRSDGSMQGTGPVVDRVQVRAMTALADRLYFTAYTTVSDSPGDGFFGDSLSLRVLNETGTGAQDLAGGLSDLLRLGDASSSLFIARIGSDFRTDQVWETDGTPEGTRQISNFDSPLRRLAGIGEEQVQIDDQVYLALNQDAWGLELWRVDLAPASGAMGDRIWHDLDGDGIQDANEPGLAGVLVALESCDGSPLRVLASDGDGHFEFDRLAPGRYRLRFTAPAGFDFSPRSAGSDYRTDSNPDPASGATRCRTLQTGQRRLAIDSGLVVR